MFSSSNLFHCFFVNRAICILQFSQNMKIAPCTSPNRNSCVFRVAEQVPKTIWIQNKIFMFCETNVLAREVLQKWWRSAYFSRNRRVWMASFHISREIITFCVKIVKKHYKNPVNSRPMSLDNAIYTCFIMFLGVHKMFGRPKIVLDVQTCFRTSQKFCGRPNIFWA